MGASVPTDYALVQGIDTTISPTLPMRADTVARLRNNVDWLWAQMSRHSAAGFLDQPGYTSTSGSYEAVLYLRYDLPEGKETADLDVVCRCDDADVEVSLMNDALSTTHSTATVSRTTLGTSTATLAAPGSGNGVGTIRVRLRTNGGATAYLYGLAVIPGAVAAADFP